MKPAYKFNFRFLDPKIEVYLWARNGTLIGIDLNLWFYLRDAELSPEPKEVIRLSSR